MALATPTTLSNAYGAATGWPSSLSCRPAGLVASVIRTTRGNTSRCTVCVRPALSLTVSRMRYQTLAAVSPVVGITKLPVVRPLVAGRKGWEWVS